MASKFEFALKMKHKKTQTHTANGLSGFKNIGRTPLGVAIRPVQSQRDSKQVTVEGGWGGGKAERRGNVAQSRGRNWGSEHGM